MRKAHTVKSNGERFGKGGLLERLKAETPDLREVVATGGQAEMIAAGSKHIGRVEPLLTLSYNFV